MVTLLQDLRFSVRQLLKSRGFALTAVISLALGIGATTAVFSVIYAALINPYPYPAADRIVRLMTPTPAGPRDWAGLNGAQVQQMRKASFVDAVLAMDFHAMILTGKELPENVNVVGLIGNGFSDLGLPPVLGRGILPSDAVDGQEPEPVAVLSYKFWQKHYFSDPEVIGKTLQLDHKGYTIIGVAAPRFIWYMGDVYLPLKLTQDPNLTFVTNVRLKPGVTQAEAECRTATLVRAVCQGDAETFSGTFSSGGGGAERVGDPEHQGDAVFHICRGGIVAGDRMRECVDPAAGAGRRAGARVGGESGDRREAQPDFAATADGVFVAGDHWSGIGRGVVLRDPGGDSRVVAAGRVCAGGRGQNQCAGAGVQRGGGTGNRGRVRIVASVAAVQDASRADDPVERPASGGKRAGAKVARLTDRRAGGDDACFAGRGRIGDSTDFCD